MTGGTPVPPGAGLGRCVLYLILLHLVGCAVGPDYERPELSPQLQETFVESPLEGGETVQREAAADLAAWWTRLDDPELTVLIERALSGSLNLAEARERIIAARARRGIVDADRLPQVDAAADYIYASTGDEGFSFNGAPAGVDAEVYALGVVAGWEVDLWGRVGRLVGAADAEIGFAVEDFHAARVSLAAEVARQVVLIRALDAEIAVVREGIEADRAQLSIAETRAEAGLANELDALRARRVLESDLAALPGLEGERRGAELGLARLLGVAPGEVEVSTKALPEAGALPAMGVPADLLVRRPDVRRAERDLAAETARIGAAVAERYPRLTLTGSLTLQGPDAGDMVNPDARVLRLGPGLTLPLFDGGRIDANVMLSERNQRRALLRLRQAVIVAQTEVETAAARYRRLSERVERLDDAEAAARDTEALSLDLYQSGFSDFLSVTEATVQRLAIERAGVTARRERLLRLINLYAALGGGWDAPAVVSEGR